MEYRGNLLKYWGFADFRPGQEKAVQPIISNHDTLVIFPTGSGKSLCYQLAGLSLPHLTLVISPLLALMADQVQALQRKNLPAASWTSQTSTEEKQQLLEDMKSHSLKFLYLSPEKLLSPTAMQFLENIPISQIVIDEAHCVSQWSADFRPHYGKIPLFLDNYVKKFPRPVMTAFTATATPATKAEIVRLLALRQQKVIALPFLRSHLRTTIIPVESEAVKRLRILEVLRWWNVQPGCCLIYAATRRETEKISHWLTLCGFPCDYFHAGRPTQEKQAILAKYLANPHTLLVATNAFGLGVDKPDIRVVLHHTPPVSLEAYAQEAGRAGRDGKTAWPILFFSESDLARNFSFTSKSKKEHRQKKRAWEQVQALLQFAKKGLCYRRFLYEYFLLPETEKVERTEIPACGCGHCSATRPWEDFSRSVSSVPLDPLLQQRKILARQLQVPPYFFGSEAFLRKLSPDVSDEELRQKSGAAYARVRWLTSALKPVQ